MKNFTQITEKALNEKVMTLLRARASCTDARSVTLELVNDAMLPYNWRVVHFDPGHGDRYACKLALRSIHEGLSNDFEMVGQS